MNQPSGKGLGPEDEAVVSRPDPAGQPPAAGALGPRDAMVFGPFRLLTAQRRLERDGAPVAIGGRAFSILKILLEHAGAVVNKAELLRQVWPDRTVNEGSLRFHVAELRKALGEFRYIANVAGQGYSFVAAVSRESVEFAPRASPAKTNPLALRPRPLVGRDGVLRTLAKQLLEHRFVTVVGPGGVGKTSVALALARDLAPQFDGDVCFFDVGGVVNPGVLAGGLASALGVPVQPVNAAPGIITFLQQRKMLLVLDGCEPGVDAAAALAERLVREAPDVHLLATSREALRAEGEHVHRLFPLDCPGPNEGLTAEEGLRFSAVQLFVERCASSLHGFVLTDEEAPLVSTICRKLDGLALAIELAAGQVDAFGVGGVARQLESRFALMWPGRRTAVARHQTLSATLGWSHDLLSAREQIVFRRLSVFAGSFTLKMAAELVADDDVSEAEATEFIGRLVSKSLVQFSMGGSTGSYRLLDMTRSYAFDKLSQAQEARLISRQHAQIILRLMEDAGERRAASGALSPFEVLDDVRSAIEWSLAAEGDLDLAAALAAASTSMWLQAGLLVECRFWMRRVLDRLDASALADDRRLSIQAALASAETFTDGFTESSFDCWLGALVTAKALGKVELQLTCLTVLWAHRIRSPDYGEALSLARQVDELGDSMSDQAARAMGDWMVGVTHHHLGQLAKARTLLERSLATDTFAARQAMMTRFGYDRRIPSLGVLSNLHWLEGRADQARRLGAAAVSEARRSPYAVPLCEALTWQALNLHLRGDDPGQIDDLLSEAVAHARLHFIESYVGLAVALKGLNAEAQGDAAGPEMVSEGLGLLSKSHYEVFHPLILTESARRRVQAGAHLDDGEVGALLQLEAGGSEHWCSAEVRRNLGEILLLRGERDRAAQFFADAVECSERQGALAWRLRTLLSVARAAPDERARAEARACLEDLLSRFAEGRETTDLRAASLFLANRSN